MDQLDGVVFYGLYRSEVLQKIARTKNSETTMKSSNLEDWQSIYKYLENIPQGKYITLSSDGDFVKILESEYYGFNAFEIQ